MSKTKLNEAWTEKGPDAAFDYHTPDNNDVPMGVDISIPDKVPTWNEFTQSTTFHGVRYIFDPSSRSKFRRFFWVTVCLTVIVYFIVQLSTSILKYYEYRTTTDVQVIYGEPVVFPAVTLCNQNNFRTSATAKYGLYDFINDVYSMSEDFDPDNYPWEGVNTTEFINNTAHQLQDFIDSCTWNGKDCNVTTDFTHKFTGIGVCYTYNGGSNPKIVKKPGSRAGLSLVLNIEQYEYMRGPQKGAGIKVLLHESSEEPEITDQGFVVAPGTYTLVSVNQKQIKGLPPPWGTCGENVEPYSVCTADCRNAKVANLCDCRDVFMAAQNGVPERYCDMNETFSCIPQAFDTLQDNSGDCNCTLACHRVVFESSLSYAMLSEFNIDQIALTDKVRKADVTEKFEKALETQQRVVKNIKEEDELFYGQILKTASNLHSALNQTYTKFLNTSLLAAMYQIPNVLTERSLLETDLLVAKRHSQTIFERKRAIQIGHFYTKQNVFQLMNGLLAYDDNGQSEVLEAIQHCIDEGLNGSTDPFDVCQYSGSGGSGSNLDCDKPYVQELCYLNENAGIDTFLKVDVFVSSEKDDVINDATHELTNLDDYTGFINFTFFGQMPDPVKFPEHTLCENNLEHLEKVVLPALLTFVNSLDSLKNASNLQQLKGSILNFETTLNSTLGPALLNYDPVKRWTVPSYYSSTRDYETLNCSWFKDIAYEETDAFLLNIYNILPEVSTQHSSLLESFNSISEQLSKMLNRYNAHLVEPVAALRSYLDQNLTKQKMADIFTEVDLTRTLSEIHGISEDLEGNIKQFEDTIESYSTIGGMFYTKMTAQSFPYLTDRTKSRYLFLQEMMKWYNDLGGAELIKQHLINNEEISGHRLPENTNFTEENIWLAIEDAIIGFRVHDAPISGSDLLVANLKQNVVTETSSLLSQLDILIPQMEHYEEEISISTDFYMKNFLQLDIFYKELSYDKIDQQKAFQFQNLLGEVGGFLGLLLGASVITVCELLDYLVMHCLAGCRRRNKSGVSSVDLHPDEKTPVTTVQGLMKRPARADKQGDSWGTY